MDQVERIMSQIKKMLFQLGFKETIIKNEYRGDINYVYGDKYCDITYLKKLGFIIGYANSYEEAAKYWHCDGDSFPLDMGEEAILEGIEKEIRENLSK